MQAPGWAALHSDRHQLPKHHCFPKSTEWSRSGAGYCDQRWQASERCRNRRL